MSASQIDSAVARDTAGKPVLPDGLVVIVKEECECCRMVAPLLTRLGATVYTQDDPAFPADVAPIYDGDLAVSWHHDIETVPTLIRVEDGVEVERTVGWLRSDWQRISGIADLGDALPVMRPGCGSKSVDPDLVDSLRARFAGDVLKSRHIELAELDDEMEVLFDRGFTDGLPVVPPTPERVLRMLEGTTRAPGDIVAVVPPDLVEVTVEKIAINAVMAGCKPEYLPWVITIVEAICNDEFNIHGVLATTMPVGPVIVCNGPGTKAIGMNAAGNVLGQGNRANLTIGRAVQLVVRNVGGGVPGGVDRAAHGNPGKISFCFPELEDSSPFTSLATSRGVPEGTNAITVFPGEGPRVIVDQKARDPYAISKTFAACLRTSAHPKAVLGMDAMLIIGPEHARIYAEAGWTREQVLDEIHANLQIPGSELVQGAGGMAEGLPESFRNEVVPKFRSGGLLLVHAGGGAGLFSMCVAGWANGKMGSTPVTRIVTP
jgi:hypothetical protein